MLSEKMIRSGNLLLVEINFLMSTLNFFLNENVFHLAIFLSLNILSPNIAILTIELCNFKLHVFVQGIKYRRQF